MAEAGDLAAGAAGAEQSSLVRVPLAAEVASEEAASAVAAASPEVVEAPVAAEEPAGAGNLKGSRNTHERYIVCRQRLSSLRRSVA